MAKSGFPNLAQLMGDDIVTVFVGPREKRYSVHKALLTTQSDFFERALNGNFKEADEQTIRLPEETPDAFDLLIGWLYQNQIPVLGYTPGPFDDFPKGLIVGATKIGKALPPNSGTIKIAYRPHEEPAPTLQMPPNSNLTDRFHHISTQPEYEMYSSDELRLEDYSNNTRLLQQRQHFSKSSSFPVSTSHIKGIPYCSSIEDIIAAEEAHQLSLLRLCLFAETICWIGLFNIAMSSYIQGENFLSPRPMPTEHIELIYQRAHEESPCRKLAADSTISQMDSDGQIYKSMDLVEHWPSFLEDIFKRLRLSRDLTRAHNPKLKAPCEYHVHDLEEKTDQCSAESAFQHFALDGTGTKQQKLVASYRSQGRSRGSGNVNKDVGPGREDYNVEPGSSDEVRYTTYTPNIGYTTRTLGYSEPVTSAFTSSPFSFGRLGDGMDWRGATTSHVGNTESRTSSRGMFGQGLFPDSFHSSIQPTTSTHTASGNVSLFQSNLFGNMPSHQPNVLSGAASTPSNPATTTSSSFPLNATLGASGTSIPIPVTTATTPPPASPDESEGLISPGPSVKHNSTTSPSTSTPTTNSTMTTSTSTSSEAETLNTTPKKDPSNVSRSTVSGIFPSTNGQQTVFGEVSPLTSSLPPLTSGVDSTSGIFGMPFSSASVLSKPSALSSSTGSEARRSPSSGSGSLGVSSLPSFSISSTEASNTAFPSTTSASPFSLLTARSTPLFNNQTTTPPPSVTPATWSSYRSSTGPDTDNASTPK